MNKLVRDEIPKIISNNGEYVYTRVLKPEDYVIELKKKLVEEATEVKNAKTILELKEELADVKEVVLALAKASGIDFRFIMASSDDGLVTNLTKTLFDEAYDIKKVSDKETLNRKLNDIARILNRIMEVNNIDYQDVEDVRLSKREERGGFDKKIYLIDTKTREKYLKDRGCKTCVNRNCAAPLDQIYGDIIDGEAAGKYCIDYISNYRQKK